VEVIYIFLTVDNSVGWFFIRDFRVFDVEISASKKRRNVKHKAKKLLLEKQTNKEAAL